MPPHTAARRFSTQEILDHVSRQRGPQRTESSKHAADASAALDVAVAAAGATSAASGPVAAGAPNCADQVAPATAPPSLPPRDVQPVCYTTAAVLNRPHTTADGLEGWNTFACAGGSVYQGEWRQGLKHGKGRMSHSNGDMYEGEWWEGAMCGRGRYVHSNGTVFEGVFKDNKKCGPGICV